MNFPEAFDYEALRERLVNREFDAVLDATQDHAGANLADVRLWELRGVALLQSGRAMQAEAPLRQWASIAPNPLSHTNLGSCLLILGRYAQALESFEAALALDPDADDARMLMATTLLRMCQVPRAVDAARAALASFMQAPRTVPKRREPVDFNSKANEAIVWDTLAMLARGGVHAFAIAGTLLGLVREGGLLPFDKDIDIGVASGEFRIAVNLLVDAGWKFAGGDDELVNPIGFVHPHAQLSMDLCAFRKDPVGGGVMSGFWLRDAPWEWNRVTVYPEMPLVQVDGPAGPVWQFKHPEQYLTALYGDWKTPDRNFDSVVSAKNLQSFSPLVQYYAFSRIYQQWKEASLSKALSLARHSLLHLPDDAVLQEAFTRLEAAMAKSAAA